jgi:RNA recognition motif-containing protein
LAKIGKQPWQEMKISVRDQQERKDDSMNIYVGNLSFQMTEEDLRTEFEKFGKVNKASIIKDKLSGRSKGFGFVEMPNLEEAEAAIKKLDGTPIKGRNLKVNEARPRDSEGPPRQAKR